MRFRFGMLVLNLPFWLGLQLLPLRLGMILRMRGIEPDKRASPCHGKNQGERAHAEAKCNVVPESMHMRKNLQVVLNAIVPITVGWSLRTPGCRQETGKLND